MKKPCSTCDSLIVVNGKSLPNPQCHSCRAKARLGNCEECAKPMDRGKPSAIRRFCSRQCSNASRSTIKMLNCDWCDKSYTYTSEHKDNKYSICSRRCAYNLRMKPSSPWKPPRVVVPRVEYVNTCRDCGIKNQPYKRLCESCGLKRRRSSKIACRAKRRSLEVAALVECVDPLDIYQRDLGVCYLCSEVIDLTLHFNHRDSFTLDHVIPLALGGDTSYINLASAHRSCNSRKGARAAA